MEKQPASAPNSEIDPGTAASGDEDGGVMSEEEELERALADVPFEDLQRALADGSHVVRRRGAGKQKTFSRENKNRPMEISSKSRVPVFRDVIQAPKKVVRDPRFESLGGTVNTDGFIKRYNFLFDVELPAEKERLQKLIRKSKDPKVIEESKNHLTWIDKQLRSASKKNVGSDILKEHKRKEREAIKNGKKPYYMKQSAIREMELKEKFSELKEKGKLESFMEKRRKKNASKDHRYMPYRRTSEGVQE